MTSLHSMFRRIVDLISLDSMTLDHEVVVLNRNVHIFLFHSWEVGMHLEIGLRLDQIDLEDGRDGVIDVVLVTVGVGVAQGE